MKLSQKQTLGNFKYTKKKKTAPIPGRRKKERNFGTENKNKVSKCMNKWWNKKQSETKTKIKVTMLQWNRWDVLLCFHSIWDQSDKKKSSIIR